MPRIVELAVAGGLREGQGRRLAGQVLDRLRLASTELLSGQDADREGRRLQLALARLPRRDDDPLGDQDHQPEGDAHCRAAREPDALLRRCESVWSHPQAVLAVRKVAEREPTVHVRRGSLVDGARQADRGVRDPAARRVLHRARDPTGLSRTKGVRRLQAGDENKQEEGLPVHGVDESKPKRTSTPFLSPVVNACEAHSEIDTSRLGLTGLSFGGYLRTFSSISQRRLIRS